MGHGILKWEDTGLWFWYLSSQAMRVWSERPSRHSARLLKRAQVISAPKTQSIFDSRARTSPILRKVDPSGDKIRKCWMGTVLVLKSPLTMMIAFGLLP